MDYEKQASDLAAKLGLELIINKVEHRKHFSDDTEARDVYNITLKRGDKSYTFDFGQSIAKSCNTVKVKQTDLVDEIEVFAGFQIYKRTASIYFTLYKKDDWKYDLLDLVNKLEENWFDNYKSTSPYWDAKYKEKKISKEVYADKVDCKGVLKNTASTIIRAVQRELEKETEKYVERLDKTPPTFYVILCCLTKYDPGDFNNFCDDYGYSNDSIKALKTYEAVKTEFVAMQSLFSDEELELLTEIQ